MKNPFRKGTNDATTGQHAELITLTAWNDSGIHAFTPISSPDALIPTGHSLPGINPHVMDLRQTITDKVQALARAGALDEFTYDVLDSWIDTWHETWVASVVQHAEERRRVAARLFATHRQNLVTEKAQLSDWVERKAELDVVYNALRLEAGFTQLDASPLGEKLSEEHHSELSELLTVKGIGQGIRNPAESVSNGKVASSHQFGVAHGRLRPVEGSMAADE
ncbi:hypothetical protein QN357_13880 [Cryobacterium sp. RTC2.1]|uniref:hypothetical protein n=1 Tax=Cryobacterium sp. RTC2.1 TaxID=3048634 RepID=UPI002B23C542|nr:hypothetical protein [Cryobacterium sp. RTC2.1]MEB0004016.1 hypothetical protein [Cryobacterium sp. RTC2.1]